MSANIGQVEFLVKFDTMGRSFEQAVRKAMGKVDLGTQDFEELKHKINNLDKYIAQVTMGGPNVDYIGFLSMAEKSILPNLEKGWRKKELIDSIIKSGAPSLKELLAYEEADDPREVIGDFIDNFYEMLSEEVKTMMRSEKAFEAGISAWNKIWTNIEEASGSENIAEPINKAINAFGKELPQVTRAWKELIERISKDIEGIEVRVGTEAGGEGEIAYYRIFKQIGEGDLIEDVSELQQEIGKIAEDLGIEEWADIFLKRTTEEANITREDINSIVDELLESKELKKEMLIPPVLRDILEERNLGDLFAGSREEAKEIGGYENISDVPEHIRKQFDVIQTMNKELLNKIKEEFNISEENNDLVKRYSEQLNDLKRIIIFGQSKLLKPGASGTPLKDLLLLKGGTKRAEEQVFTMPFAVSKSKAISREFIEKQLKEANTELLSSMLKVLKHINKEALEEWLEENPDAREKFSKIFGE